MPRPEDRTNNDGQVASKLRFPSDSERLNNKQRETKRRDMTWKIFAGLRAHGNYCLPRHVDNNDLLMALSKEAGWHVQEDGTIYRKVRPETPSCCATSQKDLEHCGFVEYGHTTLTDGVGLSENGSSPGNPMRDGDVDLTLSL